MLFVVDIGNTHTTFGLFDGDRLRCDWRVETRAERTADELVATLKALFELEGMDIHQVTSAIVSSVVPPASLPMERLFSKHLKVPAMVVGPGMRTGMPVLYENPKDLGADRIVNAVAAYARWSQGAIVVDFGTATTLDVVTAKGEYAGGVITPGLLLSANALYRATAKLPKVEIARPKNVVATNTVNSIQAGLVFGYAGMIDALVRRIRAEVSFSPKVVATGGLGALVAKESETIEEYDELLTLRGLKILHDRNVG